MSTAPDTHDASGRRTRLQPISTGKRVTLQERDWLWLRMLHEHGPLASSFLLAFAAGLGASQKRARERLTDLFNEDNTAHDGPYLARPPQQFHTLDSRYNQIVYDLSAAGKRALEERGLRQSEPRASAGPWVHRFMVSSITASIHLAANANTHLTYIPQADILTRARAELSYPVEVVDPATGYRLTKALKADALFGLQYETPAGSRFRFYVVEADRSTEPFTSKNFNRKSVLRSFLQYREYIGAGRYKVHLALTAPLLVLTVCNDPKRSERICRLIADQVPGGNAYMLFQTWPDFSAPFRPPAPNPALLHGNWARAGRPPFRIDRV